MRIARVVTRLNLGGPARQVLASDPELVARGHQVRVLCGQPEPGEGDLFEELVARGVEAVRVDGLGRGPRAARDLSALVRLRRELVRYGPDLVHTHASKAGLLGRLAAPRTAARVHTFHGHVLEGYFPRAASRALVALERRLARRTDAVVAVSRATGDDLVRLGVVEPQRLFHSPPGVDLEPYLALDPAPDRAARGALGLAAERFTVALVGRLAPVKRPALAGAVLRALVHLRVDAQLVVVGDGALRGELLEAAGEARGRVHLLGALADPAPALAACDAVLMCSRSEGLPVALVEAAAAARPAVALAVGGVGEVVEDRVTGRLLAPDGGEPALVAALAAALAELAERPELARGLGLAARTRAAAAFGPRGLADRLEAVYARALARRRGAGAGEVRPCAS